MSHFIGIPQEKAFLVDGVPCKRTKERSHPSIGCLQDCFLSLLGILGDSSFVPFSGCLEECRIVVETPRKSNPREEKSLEQKG